MCTAASQTAARQSWHIGAVFDANYDGSPDILWRNYATGANAIWYFLGTSFIGTASLPSVRDIDRPPVAPGAVSRDELPTPCWLISATAPTARPGSAVGCGGCPVVGWMTARAAGSSMR